MEEASYYLEARTGWTWGHWFQDASYWEGSLLNGGVPPSSTLIMEYEQQQAKIGISVEIPDFSMSDHGNFDTLSADTLQNIDEVPVGPSAIDGDQTRSSPLIPLPEKQHVCNICEKKFRRPSELVGHLRVHAGDKPFQCTQCGKSFAHEKSFKRHLNIHNEDKCFTCNVCHKSFARSIQLKIHQRVHTNEKPFTCSICGKSFTQSSTLKRHILTHTKEKPHTCDRCGKCFSLKSNLKVHAQTHTGEKPYSCQTCGKRFTTLSNVSQHIRHCTRTTTVREEPCDEN